MAESVFLQHGVEIGYTSGGQKSKQAIPNLKETITSDKMVALGQLFVQMIPKDVVKVDEVVTVKRTRHQSS
ncbi:hypothetical protein I6N95_17595 [Vagococcus sp. BWB3-3]|uniref:Uncharacterized protein n=1 Tax=Vagococcus allomyrinae TaxID=2794353 RepID=A0A940PDA9_9ENTE|nr:hypothetical protein [Vagococcus allomyrinae]MBP1042834.1 hypothetical protein [Vagococcus allomyrinae]